MAADEADHEEDAGRALAALEVLDGAREDVLGGAGRDRAEVVDQRLGRRLADQAQHRNEHDQRREDREHGVVGERGRPVGEVVLLKLLDGALEHPDPAALAEVGRALGASVFRGCGVVPLALVGHRRSPPDQPQRDQARNDAGGGDPNARGLLPGLLLDVLCLLTHLRLDVRLVGERLHRLAEVPAGLLDIARGAPPGAVPRSFRLRS